MERTERHDESLYVGLSVDDAVALAVREGWHPRVGHLDGPEEDSVFTADMRPDRISLLAERGVIRYVTWG